MPQKPGYNPFTGQLQLVYSSLPTYIIQPLPTDGLVQTTTLYTVPAIPAGVNRFILTRLLVRLSTAMTGAGNCMLRVGSSVGGQEIILDQVILAVTPLGIIGGETFISLGTDMNPVSGFEAVYDAGQIITATVTPGAPVTGGAVTYYVYGISLT